MTTEARQGPPIEILLVEDDPADIRLTREQLRESKLRNNLHVVQDGDEAIDFLLRREPYADSPRPDLVLLDLNLPRVDGRDVLAFVKGHEDLKTIPVVILTTSEADEDILRSYKLHANCYITKPLGLDQFGKVVRSIEHFWLTIVKLPITPR